MPGEIIKDDKTKNIKERIDKDNNNLIEIDEINKFIFDENEGEKNLSDLGQYLNDLPIYSTPRSNEIKNSVKNAIENYKEWGEITKKITTNTPLTKEELNLIYLDMVCDVNFKKTYQLSNEQLKFDTKKPIDQICNGKLIQFLRQKYLTFTYTGEKKESLQKGGDNISDHMFQQLLTIEGSQGYVSQIQSKNFGEKFPTGPYGMVFKHIDKNGNLLNKPIPFKNGEKVTKEWAVNNAKAYYDKRAQEWKVLLDKNGYEYNQAQLDSLVSASGGTAASVERLQNFVLSHREKPAEISNFISTFATKSAGNGQQQPGLVIRRQFESNWFKGIQRPIEEYQKEYHKQKATEKKNNPKSQQRSKRRRR